MNNLLKKINTNDNFADQFIFYSEKIKKLAQTINIQLKTFDDATLPHFHNLPDYKRNEVLFAIKNFVHICETTLSNNKELSDTRSLTWFALKEMGLRFNSDIFSHISDTDVLEVYTNDNIQVFRNFRFLELISYTLEDIFCRPWTELFDHKNPEKIEKILEIASDYERCKSFDTISLNHLGTYSIEEVCSSNRFQYTYKMKYISPIRDENKRPFGYLVIESADIINQQTPHQSLYNYEADIS